ncbi:MAG: hypothetical protein QF718_07525 [Phycisphaerales bacterium]|jgi:hypothetical protein|nr:hypothetical protein [Phycisphaerales bacterium]
MNKKLQNLVATQYENAGFETLANEIRGANGVAGVRKVAVKVIKKLCDLDSSGFGQDIKNICNEGENNG